MTWPGLPTPGDTVDLDWDAFGQAEPGQADRQTILVLSVQNEPPLQTVACGTDGGGARGVAAQIVQEMALADEGLSSAMERAG